MILIKDITCSYGNGLGGELYRNMASHYTPIVGRTSGDNHQLDAVFYGVGDPSELLAELLWAVVWETQEE